MARLNGWAVGESAVTSLCLRRSGIGMGADAGPLVPADGGPCESCRPYDVGEWRVLALEEGDMPARATVWAMPPNRDELLPDEWALPR